MLHTIHFICPVTASSVSQLQNHCLSALINGATEINIHMSSRGGETECGFAAYSFLKSLPVKVRTHNISNVESIANVIFLAGSERFADPLSRFLLHPLSWGVGGGMIDHDRLKEIGNCLDHDLTRFIHILNIEAKDTIKWSECIDKSTIVTADDAILNGFVSAKKSASLDSSGANWFVSVQ